MGARSTPSSPSTDNCATDPVKKTSEECTKKCWTDDFDKKLSVANYGRYFRKYKKDGTEYSAGELPATTLTGKIYAPVKTGSKITVEVRFKPEKLDSVTDADVTQAKTKLENGVKKYWNGKFTLEANDPECGKKSFTVEYKIVWVDSDQDYTIKIHETYPREGVTGFVMDVSKTTSDWVYAHEFGHCVGLPDEYSYVNAETETVKYIKPDGTLDAAVSAPYNGKPKTATDATLMAAYNNTTLLPRHCWNVAIEVQDILTAGLGRKITCTIK